MISRHSTEDRAETERRPRVRRAIKKRGILPSFGDIVLPIVSVAAVGLLILAGRQFFINGIKSSPDMTSTRAYADSPALIAEREKAKEESMPPVKPVAVKTAITSAEPEAVSEDVVAVAEPAPLVPLAGSGQES